MPVQSIRQQLLRDSFCTVRAFPAIPGVDVSGVWIEMGGPLAHLGGMRLAGHTRLQSIRAKIDAARTLFASTLVESALSFPYFGARPVCVQVLVAGQIPLKDPHSYPKIVGSWLKSCGVIESDRQAEIHIYQKSRYPNLNYAPGTTLIVIQDALNVTDLREEVLLEERKRSTQPSRGMVGRSGVRDYRARAEIGNRSGDTGDL